MSIKNHLLLGKLSLNSTKLLNEIQNEVKKDFLTLNFSSSVSYSFDNENPIKFFKKNFFTLLMLSLLNETKIPKTNLISYGKIILYLRQIVTSVDNILDNEDKGIINLSNFSDKTVKNSFLSLICQNFLTKECLKISPDGKINEHILEEINFIAFSESLRNRDFYQIYPSSTFILDKIHSGIGGKLLEISLFPAKLIENNKKINDFSLGLYEIGMSLQALDDLFDVNEDIENKKVNLAFAYYLETNNIKESEFKSLDKIFIENFLQKILKQSYYGFSILEKSGFPLNKKDITLILKKLFILRGLGEYSYLIN